MLKHESKSQYSGLRNSMTPLLLDLLNFSNRELFIPTHTQTRTRTKHEHIFSEAIALAPHREKTFDFDLKRKTFRVHLVGERL